MFLCCYGLPTSFPLFPSNITPFNLGGTSLPPFLIQEEQLIPVLNPLSFNSSSTFCELYCIHVINIFFPSLGQSLFLLIAIKESLNTQTHVVDVSLELYWSWWDPVTHDTITSPITLIAKQTSISNSKTVKKRMIIKWRICLRELDTTDLWNASPEERLKA